MRKLYKRSYSFYFIILIDLLFLTMFIFGGKEITYDEPDYQKNYESSNMTIGQLTGDEIVSQSFISTTDLLDSISLKVGTFDKVNFGVMSINVIDEFTKERMLFEVDLSTLIDNSFLELSLNNSFDNAKGHQFSVEITSSPSTDKDSVTLWGQTNHIMADEGEQLSINGVMQKGSLTYKVVGRDKNFFGKNYMFIFLLLNLLMVIFFEFLYKSKLVIFVKMQASALLLIKYSFLLSVLVKRDFNVKYKRSSLGIFWSLLNPILTMGVQYIVFVNLFRFSVDNYAVYLLIGVVLFNFFNEGTTQALTSLVSNAGLITKVPAPRFIYPLSKIISSFINVLFSMIPLIFLMVITGITINSSFVLIIFAMIFMMMFTLGIGMILSILMVYFRDTQFLWGVFTMLWMYLTPIIYPIDVLPDFLKFLMKFNPLYHMITYWRQLMMQGVSPNLRSFIVCFCMSLGTLLIGSYIFAKYDKHIVIHI